MSAAPYEPAPMATLHLAGPSVLHCECGEATIVARDAAIVCVHCGASFRAFDRSASVPLLRVGAWPKPTGGTDCPSACADTGAARVGTQPTLQTSDGGDRHPGGVHL